jgi:hypothetical protein
MLKKSCAQWYLSVLTLTPAHRQSDNYAVPVLMVVFDTSSAFLATIRCLTALRSWAGLRNQRHGIMAVLLEQGTCSPASTISH